MVKGNIIAQDFIPEEYWVKNYSIVKNEYIPISDTFVYEDNGIIKGFISIIDNSFIGALFIDKEYQNKGIGKKLIDFCKGKYSELKLCVYAQNNQAVGFYKNCGFVITSEQNNSDSGYPEYEMARHK
jgi:putative acetyltransferase